MTSIGLRYEDAYAKAYPFDKLLDEMFNPEMVEEAVGLLQKGIEDDVETVVIINNWAGGNAPLLPQRIAEEFLAD